MRKILVLSFLVLSACGTVDVNYSESDSGIDSHTVDAGPELSFDEQMFSICGNDYQVICANIDSGTLTTFTCKQLLSAAHIANPKLILSGETITTCKRDTEVSCHYLCN
jgi:hypothetical protein